MKRTNLLPLPKKTISEITNIISKNANNYYIKNPLKNCINMLLDYEYKDAVKTLEYMQKDYPMLMDYKKNISAIKSAEIRYKKM